MHQGVARGMDGGRFKRRLSEVNARAMSRGQNELVCEFKMAVGDMVSIRGQVMEYMYIPTQKGVGEVWCGLRLEGVSRRDCWKRTSDHSF